MTPTINFLYDVFVNRFSLARPERNAVQSRDVASSASITRNIPRFRPKGLHSGRAGSARFAFFGTTSDDTAGFTLIELMVVVAIIALLSLIAVPMFTNFINKAKRTEVYLNLGALHTAEKLYWAEHGRYSPVLMGPDGIGWRPEGEPLYTYGFAGADGVNFITGKLKAPGSALAPYAKADQQGFTAVAIADIDGDGTLDIVTMDEGRQIKIVQDDCA